MVDFRREDLLAELDRGVILTSEILDRRQPIQGLGPVVVLLGQLPRRLGGLDPLRGLALGDQSIYSLELRLVLAASLRKPAERQLWGSFFPTPLYPRIPPYTPI